MDHDFLLFLKHCVCVYVCVYIGLLSGRPRKCHGQQGNNPRKVKNETRVSTALAASGQNLWSLGLWFIFPTHLSTAKLGVGVGNLHNSHHKASGMAMLKLPCRLVKPL